MPLSPMFLEKLRTTLTRCPQFQTHSLLCALFVDERIAQWGTDVEDAQSTGARVDLLVALLQDRQNTQRQSALCLFLRVLGNAQPQGDMLREEVLALAAELNVAPAVAQRWGKPPAARAASMIDREDATALFRQLLVPDSPARVLRLLGSEKMGKSHLLRVYRNIAREDYHALCALVDVRNPTLSYSDVLYLCSQELGIAMPTYQAARDDLTRRLAQNSGLSFSQFLNKLGGGGRGAEANAPHHERHRLTAAFVQDLRTLPATIPVVLLFDTLEQAASDIQTWITHDLLTALYTVGHVRVVLAGRHLPESPTMWHDAGCLYELPPVEIHHYASYCAHIGLRLEEERVVRLHQTLKGRPGALIDVQSALVAAVGGV